MSVSIITDVMSVRPTLRMATMVALIAACFPLVVAASSSVDGANSLDTFFEDLPVVLSASRLKQSAADAPVAVTVIDRDLIVASGARQLVDVLRLVPGFYVGYLSGNNPVVAYHGLSDFYAKRMQVLVDGVSIYSPLLGGVEWMELPLALQDIERIEVVRGPNAVTYGANAFLAVINIITRDPATEAGVQLATNAGGNGIRDLQLRTARRVDDLRYSISVGQRNDDGYYHLPDSSRIEMANLQAHYRIHPRDELSIKVRASRGVESQGRNVTQGFYKINIGPGEFDPERGRLVDQQTVQLRWTHAASVEEEFWVQGYHHQRTKTEYSQVSLPLPGGASLPAGFDTDFDVTRDDLEFQMSRKSGEATRLVWGGHWRQDRARSWALLNRHDWQGLRLARLFGNIEYRPAADLVLHGGAMLERNSMTGSSLSPRLAATYRILPGHSLRAGISRANRTPTLNEEKGSLIYASPSVLLPLTRGLPLAILAMSSGGLIDERIRSSEVGYTVDMPHWQAGGDIRWFADRIDHLITLTATRPVVTMTNNIAWDYVNSASTAHVRGVELSGHWRPWEGARFQASAAYTRIDSAIPDSTESAPSPTLSLLFNQELPGRIAFSAAYHRIGSLKWQSSPASLPDYGTLDLRLAKRHRWGDQHVEIALVTRNALGGYADYKPANLHRRVSFVQVNYSF